LAQKMGIPTANTPHTDSCLGESLRTTNEGRCSGSAKPQAKDTNLQSII
jgi:hypothetical protein